MVFKPKNFFRFQDVTFVMYYFLNCSKNLYTKSSTKFEAITYLYSEALSGYLREMQKSSPNLTAQIRIYRYEVFCDFSKSFQKTLLNQVFKNENSNSLFQLKSLSQIWLGSFRKKVKKTQKEIRNLTFPKSNFLE